MHDWTGVLSTVGSNDKARAYRRDVDLVMATFYGCKEKPKQFDVRFILIGKSIAECAAALAAHFNEASNEFHPLQPAEIPVTHHQDVTILSLHEVSRRLRAFWKPKSMVNWDLFPQLVTVCVDFLAIPLSDIYNEVAFSRVWPIDWKKEHVTAIPKCCVPATLNDLRNISCTLLISICPPVGDVGGEDKVQPIWGHERMRVGASIG